MLHLVVNTGVALNSTVSLFLILEVIPHSLFQFCKLTSIFRVRHSQNLAKENVVFIVKSGVISSKGFIPHIRLWYWMLKVPLVSKISVLDMLSKPVLSPLDLLIIDWSIHLDKSLTEQDVFLLMLLAIVPWQVNGVTELFLFIIEMVPHELLKLVNFCLLIGVLLNLQHNLEESLVLIIQTFVENFKFIVPNIRFRCFVSSCKLVSVFEVSVLDVLSKPVLSKVHVLLGYRVGNPGQGFKEDVMLFLVGICITWFTAFHELLFFIIEVISVDISVLVQKINIIRVFT